LSGSSRRSSSSIDAAVGVESLRAGYSRLLALEDVTFELEPGELVAVVGPNGSGKSTLLKVLAGLLQPWSGRVSVLGDQPGAQPLRVHYLPQSEAVDWSFPVSVRDVVLMGRFRRAGWLHPTSRADMQVAERALEQVGMLELADRQIGELSGGQQRRVFLARALAQDPEVYLLDEPVTGVDPKTEDDLMALLNDERQRGKTIVASTHDLAGVAVHFTRLLSLNRTLIADGPAALVRDPHVLRATYGGHLIHVEPGAVVLLDDAHHPHASP
jgi:ABC-type Mn2+/Zn2+ transport system ATPase subunit